MKNTIENKTANDARWNFLARKIRIKRNHITISNLEFLLLIRVTPVAMKFSGSRAVKISPLLNVDRANAPHRSASGNFIKV